MEMSHRSKVFDEIIKEAEADIRKLMNIPDNYKVLFLQGGASLFFAQVPMNLMKNKKAGYILTGQWAKKAYQEAKIYGEAVELASSADKTFSYIPDVSDLPITDDMDYVYICENNTIYGTKYKTLPDTKGKILVSDVSSCFLSEPVDVTKYGVIYGGVQKNIGPAGCVIAIIREDLIDMDFMNLNQSAHGDIEFGHICTRMRVPRKVVCGYWKNEDCQKKIAVWARVAAGVADAKNVRCLMFGMNMNNVAVTDGDRVEFEQRLGNHVVPCKPFEDSVCGNCQDRISAVGIHKSCQPYPFDFQFLSA